MLTSLLFKEGLNEQLSEIMGTSHPCKHVHALMLRMTLWTRSAITPEGVSLNAVVRCEPCCHVLLSHYLFETFVA